MQQQGRFSLLGLGDIIMPGLVLCFVLRFESRKRVNNLYNNNPLLFINRLTYFQCCLLGYCAGAKIFSSISYSSSSISFRLIDSYHFIGSFQMCSTSTSLSRSIYSHTLVMHCLFKGKYPYLNWNEDFHWSSNCRVILVQCGQIHSLRITTHHPHRANY